MGDSVIRDVPGNLVTVNRDSSMAERTATVTGVRAGLGVSGKIPQNHVPAPIPRNVDKHALHVRGDVP